MKFGWTDFEPESEMSGDGSGNPETHYATITTLDESGWADEEIAVICHRTCGDKYPMDGPAAKHKRAVAAWIAAALTAYDIPIPRNNEGIRT